MLNACSRSVARTIFPLVALFLLFELSFQVSKQLTGALSVMGIWTYAVELLIPLVAFGMVNIPLLLAERIWPGNNSQRNYIDGAKFWIVYFVVAYAWSKVALLILSWIKLTPLVFWKVEGSPAVVALGLLISLWAFDFFYYWLHRMQHHVPILWRIHRVHHAITHLNCLNSYHHPVEDILRFPFITIPLGVLLKVDVPDLVLLSAFIAGWGQFIHSDTRINFGRANLFFADNAYHRIHHSADPAHFNKNFAGFFPIWDWLFGSYQARGLDFSLDVGLADLASPRTVADYLLIPFRRVQETEGGSIAREAINADSSRSAGG